MRFALSLTVILCLASCASYTSVPEASPTGSAPGKGAFEFSAWVGPALRVWTYVPRHAGPETPVLFIMHGHKREPENYLDDWVKFAEAKGFLLVAPEFSNTQFPGARSYNLGGVIDSEGNATPKAGWAFSAIEPIFEAVKNLTGNQQRQYMIYGHSAGAQFVHRFLYFVPGAHVSRAIAANAGWYTMPNLELAFPYGLASTPATQENLRVALGQRLVILLGTADNDPTHESLRRTPEANAQGAHRLARGQTFFKMAATQATELDLKFCWRVQYAPGVAHEHERMAASAARLLAEPPRKMPCSNGVVEPELSEVSAHHTGHI